MTRASNEALVTVRGTVEALFYTSLKFSAGRLRVDASQTVSFAGALMVRAQDAVVLHGTWEIHPKFGRQLKVTRFEFDQRLRGAGLAHYLASHPALRGIGPVKAQRIADAFGDDFDRVIDQEPNRVAKTAKLSAAAVGILRDEWLRTRSLNASLTWMAAFDLTHFQMTTLITKFGNAVVTMLETDPYLLVREIPGFGFKRVDLVAQKTGVPKKQPSRIRAGIVHCVADRLDQGDCWVDYEALIDLANELLVMDVADSRDRIEHELDAVIAAGTLECESIGGRFLVALPHILAMERDLAEVFATAVRTNLHFSHGDPVSIDARLTPGQCEAVRAALEHNLVLVCGSAGSGKSFVIGAITKLYEQRAKKVVLAAPTGKAAKRIEQVVGREAFTIHRLLGYTGKTFALGIDNPIRADIVMIDEVSMVDVPLAWHLLQAIDFTRTCVVLVGDHNQLPPVGPGNPLRDLIERQPIPVVVLDQVVRQAGVLKENSLAILRGEVRRTAPAGINGTSPWVVANRLTDALAAQRYVLELFEAVLVEQLGFDLLADVQVLTPMRTGELGVGALNVALQRLVQKKLWGIDVPPSPPSRTTWRPQLLRHDRVIQTRNNYELNVMNGAIGLVTEVNAKAGGLKVQFDDQSVRYTRETARELSLAYALTIHKCVHPETLIETRRGLLPIRSVSRDGGDVVATPDGPRPYDAFVENPAGELLELVTEDGYRLTVTPEHGVDVWTDDGFIRVAARDIAPGAVLRLKLGVTCDPVEAPVLDEPPVANAKARRYRYPRTVTAELAEFLGLMVADGTLFDRGFRLAKRHADVRDRFASLCELLFGAAPRCYSVEGSYVAKVGSAELAGWLRQLGGMEPRAKAVPDSILRAPVALHAAFLRGLFENGTVRVRSDGRLDYIAWRTTHPALEQAVRTMLLRLGIIAGATPNQPGAIYLYGQNARRFYDQVGFVASVKQRQAAHTAGDETRYVMPVTKEEAHVLRSALVPIAVLSPSTAMNIVRRRAISRHAAETALSVAAAKRVEGMAAAAAVAAGEAGSVTLVTLAVALLRERLGFHYSAVREVLHTTGPSMCIRVPDGHRFFQNGFSGWNSQGSEFPCVVLVVHKSHSRMHHRNLFYTGVTRARQTAIVVGDQWGMSNCAAKEQVERRKTFLSVLDLPRWRGTHR